MSLPEVRKLEQYDRAEVALAESLALFWKMDDKRNVLACICRQAALAVWAGNSARASRLFGAAGAARETFTMPIDAPELPEYNESLSLKRDTLSLVEFNAAWSVGRSLSLEKAIDYALSPLSC